MLWSSTGPSQSSPSDPCSLHLEPTAVGSPSLHSIISMAKVKNGLPRRVVGQAPLPFPQFLAASTCRGQSPHHRVLRAWPERAPRVPSHRLRAPNHTKRLHFTALIFDISILFPSFCSHYCETGQTCFTGSIVKMTGGCGEDRGDQKGNIHTHTGVKCVAYVRCCAKGFLECI